MLKKYIIQWFPAFLGFSSMMYSSIVGPIKVVDLGFLAGLILFNKQMLKEVKHNRITHLFLILFVLMLLATWLELLGFNGINEKLKPAKVVVEMVKMFLAISMFTLVSSLNASQQKKFAYGLIAGGLTISLLSMIEYVFPGKIPLHMLQMGTVGERAEGFMPDPNRFGMAMASVASICIGLFYSSNKIWWLLLTVILLITSLTSGSRGALLGIIIATVTGALLLSKKQLKKTVVYLLAGSVCIFISINFFQKKTTNNNFQSIDRAVSIVSEEEQPIDEESRFDIWSAVIKLWGKRPVFGYGLRGYKTRINLSSHNSYLEILASSGILGLFVYVLILGNLALQVVRNSVAKDDAKAQKAYTVLFLLIYLLLHTMFINIHFMLFVYGLLGLSYSYTKKKVGYNVR